MNGTPGVNVSRLARISLTSADPSGLAAFYERAFGFRRTGGERLPASALAALTGEANGATRLTLRLGRQAIELVEFDRPGRPYPDDATSSDLIFQHFAIVAADMPQAYRRLMAVSGWTSISHGGAQRLPETTGGVTAFKFRDPEGHPVELLAFPSSRVPADWQANPRGETCLGIDHSAIAVAETARSVTFYESLGLRVGACSLNSGDAQERLDAVQDPQVEVTALLPAQPTPHVELLCYRGAVRDRARRVRDNDIAATRLVFETRGATGDGLQPTLDPDGHRLLFLPADAIGV